MKFSPYIDIMYIDTMCIDIMYTDTMCIDTRYIAAVANMSYKHHYPTCSHMGLSEGYLTSLSFCTSSEQTSDKMI